MNREEAIEYLDRKGMLDSEKYNPTPPPEPEPTEEELIKSDEKEIERVMKQGKIYGDPMALID